jgi:hypothetical protein
MKEDVGVRTKGVLRSVLPGLIANAVKNIVSRFPVVVGFVTVSNVREEG